MEKLNLRSLSIKSFVTSLDQGNRSLVLGGLGTGAGCVGVSAPGCNDPTRTFCQQYSLDGGPLCVESHTCPPG